MLKLLLKVRNLIFNRFISSSIGFVRVQNEQSQPSLYNHQLLFVPRYSIPYYSTSSPPQGPIGPPIHRIIYVFLYMKIKREGIF